MNATETTRTLVTNTLDAQKKLVDVALQQTDLAAKQMVSSVETAKKLTEIGRDASIELGRAWVDAVLPAPKAN